MHENTTDEVREVDLLPVSFAQQRLWFLARFEPNSPYNLFEAFDLFGPLDPELLERSLNAVIERHEILRTTFPLVDGEPVQLITAEERLRLPVIDLRGLDEEQRSAEILRLVEPAIRKPFELTRWPLLRFLLFRVAEAEHLLLYSMHHLITDGWSEQVLLGEVSFFYGALRNGQAGTLPELPIQYGDYASWQRDMLVGETLEELLTYWRGRLEDAPWILEIPTDRKRPERVTYRGDRRLFRLSEALTQDLRELGRSRGMTLYAVLLGAFGLLLHRHSGQQDLLVGSPVVNRDQEELEGLIGLFLNTLVLRLDLRSNPSLGKYLDRVWTSNLGAQEHQHLPFEKLIAELGVERDPARNPLFQAFFNFDTEGGGGERRGELAEITLGPSRISGRLAARSAKFDLLLNLIEGPALGGFLEYSTDLFDATTVERMVRRFQVLLEGMVAQPEVRLDRLPSLAPAEQHQTLVEWNDTARGGGDPSGLVHELFREQVRLAGGAAAVLSDGQTLSFEQLAQRVAAVERALRSRGLGPEGRAAVFMGACPEALVAILGILGAGGAYVPVDPAYPESRIAFLMADAEVDVVLTLDRFRSQLPEGPAVLFLDDDPQPAAPVDAEPVTVRRENLAYVIYTSGSTGRPKGVMVSHGALAAYLAWCRRAYAPGTGGGAPIHSSLSFDLTVTSLFAPLLAGRPVLFPAAEEGGVENLGGLLAEGRDLSLVKLTPAHLDLVNRSLRPEAAASASRLLILGGEALMGRSLAFWRQHAPETRLINEYGPTEATVGCVVYEVPAGQVPAGEVSIGRPIEGVRVHLLDRRFRPVPLGAPGEIYVGGTQVSRGYLGRPARTAESYVPDPFSGQPGSRLYGTGDLARHRQDGTLELLGRIDHQLKIRGYRIEPGEIEAVLLEHPAVREAVLVGRREEGEERRLVAYLVPEGDQPLPNVDALRSFLMARVPEHMVPSYFVELDAVPLTTHGKVDHRALPAPGGERPDLGQEYVAPRNPMEEILASIWGAALGIDEVGIHDNFFSLGGDSILSIQAVALARGKGIELSLPQMFRHPTIAELAPQLSLGEASGDEVVHTEPLSLLSEEDRARLPADIEDAYPLSQLQAGMLYHIEERPDAPVFHSINSWHLNMEFDAELFRRAVLHITARHANLRTSFDLTNFSEPLQLVYREPHFPVPVEDLSSLSEAEQEAALEAYRQGELTRPFKLSDVPQLRFKIHLRGPDRIQFTLTENHAVVDGWSLHTLYNEILTCYFSLLRGEGLPELPALHTTFRDFIQLERRALASEESERFWLERIEGARRLEVPRWPMARDEEGNLPGRRFDIMLPLELTEELRQLARREAVPLKSVFLTAHLKVMSFLGGQQDVMTGLSGHGRPETTDGSQICGLFLNTLPVRHTLEPGTWSELVRQVQQREMDILPHRRYPLPSIQRHWGPQKLLETSFVYLNFHVMEPFAQSLEIGVEETGSAFIEETNFAIMTAFHHGFGNPAIHFSLQCDRNVLSDPQIEEVRRAYLDTLEAIARNPQARHETFHLLDRAERHRRFLEWNDSAMAPVPRCLVHELVEQQARRTPDHLALVCEGETLTFRQLDRRANRLAHRLQRVGVGPEVRVVIHADRSLETVLSQLAVLKAGGAYLPVEPGMPEERLGFVLRHSGAPLLLASHAVEASFDGLGVEVVRVHALEAAGQGPEALAPPEVRLEPENLAYVIYTSGSTGQPKGVAIEHHSFVHFLAAMERDVETPPGAAYALLSTFAADLGSMMIFTPLTSGGHVHVLSEERCTDPQALERYFTEYPMDALKLVPSHLAALLEHADPERILPRRWLIVAGEALDREWARWLRSVAPSSCRLFNEYGPTETTVAATLYPLSKVTDDMPVTTVPIGRPIANTQLHVLDADLQPPALCAPGELYIGGLGVGRGYLASPALTSERFVPDPFSGEPGARVYRTGDRVRHLGDGAVHFLDRLDRQVKIRGFRVELGEIEHALAALEAVREVVVVTSDALDGAPVAYVVPHGDGALDAAALRRELALHLPEPMLPAAIVRLDALPLTPNGKIDRRALPAPTAIGGSGDKLLTPRDSLELQLLHLWEEVLETPFPIGIQDDFFELGGNSLLAVRLVARIRKRLTPEFPLASILELRTIENVAQALRQDQPLESRHVRALQPHGSKPILFCVHPGHGTLFSYMALAHHLGSDQPFYGLQTFELDDLEAKQDPYLSIEDLASRYLEELREIQPEGPYFLAGWSFGGMVAFEMARQLTAAGETVAPLLLIDTRSPVTIERLVTLDAEVLKAFILLENAKDMAGLTADELPFTAEDLAVLPFDEQVDRILAEIDLEPILGEGIDRENIRRYLEVRVARHRAQSVYQPGVYPGRIVLFRAQDVYTDTSLSEAAEIFQEVARSPTYGWDVLCDCPIEVVDVPGNHETLVHEPHVQELARAMTQALVDSAAEFGSTADSQDRKPSTSLKSR